MPASAHTLVIQTAFLGDVILTTPLLSALAARYGSLDVVTTPVAAPLIETHPAVREVIPYDKRGSDRGWSGLRRMAQRLRHAGYTRAYLPHRSLRTASLALLARVPLRIGFAGPWSFLYTESRRKPAEGHESDRLLALADEAPAAYRPQLRPTPTDEQAASEALADAGEDAGSFIAIAPGSIWGSKRWPYYPELAHRLAAKGTPLVVIGSSDDAGLGSDIVAGAAAAQRAWAINTCGRLTLRQSAALIGRAALLVTNDSAPLHLATAMGTPVVAVFGPTVPAFGFGPLRAGDVSLGIDGLQCRPCSPHGPPACPLVHHRCMRELTVQAVLAAIEETGALRRWR
jgi:lipopolysaccharide heptosyltransferase II